MEKNSKINRTKFFITTMIIIFRLARCDANVNKCRKSVWGYPTQAMNKENARIFNSENDNI